MKKAPGPHVNMGAAKTLNPPCSRKVTDSANLARCAFRAQARDLIGKSPPLLPVSRRRAMDDLRPAIAHPDAAKGLRLRAQMNGRMGSRLPGGDAGLTPLNSM